MNGQKLNVENSLYRVIETKPSPSVFPDVDLISFNLNSSGAFTIIYNKLYPAVYFFARRFLETEEAEDITAEAFYKLWKLDKHFTRVESIKSFLQVCVHNDAINLLNNKKYKAENHRRFAQLEVDHIEPEEYQKADVSSEMLRLIFEQVKLLPPQPQKIFRLSYFEGLKIKEIASLLHLSENTIRNHKARALQLLRIPCIRKYGLSFLLAFYFYLS